VKLLDESKLHTSRLKDFAVWKRRFSDEFNYAQAVGPRRYRSRRAPWGCVARRND
jgi:hypothetical protein